MPSKHTFVSVIVACLLIAATAGSARATTITGGTVMNQTWTPAGNPYLIEGDIVVPAGASLTIQAGTVVQIATVDALASGLDASHVEIHVAGTLTVNGTASNGVTFASASSSAASAWYGIVVESGATSTSIAYATIENAQVGVSCSAPGNVLVVNGSTFDTDATGIDLTNGATPAISDFRAQNCGTGLATSDTAGVTLDSAVVTGSNVALELDGSAATTVKQSTVSHNSAGVATSGANVSIIDSLVTFNDTYGVTGSPGAVTVKYSDVYGNSPNYVSIAGGTGSFSCNPLYVSAPGNLRLTENSPARNVSSTGSDLGALPYTSDATPGLVGTLWHDTTLTLAGSPYTVLGDLDVPTGVTLTIEPGVVVEFAADQDLMGCGIASQQGELQLRGTLKAAGTSALPITLASTGTGRSRWYGVVFLPGAATPTFSHVNLSEGSTGIQIGIGDNLTAADLGAPTVSLALDHVTITSTEFGMSFSTGNVVVDTARVEGCLYGIQSIYSESNPPANVILSNVVATGNGTALLFESTGTSVVTSTTVNGNTEGLDTLGYDVTVENSIFTNNTLGIIGGSFPFSILHSDVWGNGTDYSAASPGEGCISADPQYVSPPSNLHLQATSACIDSGDAGGSPPNHDYDGVIRPLDGDGDGSVAYDMGAYEYVPSPICGDTVILGSEVCDDGYLNGTYGHCKADCSGMGPFCGDGTKNGSEECDGTDGAPGGGCTPQCTLESPNGAGGEGGMTDGPGSAGDGAEAGASTSPAEGGRGGNGHAGHGSGAANGNGGRSDAEAGADSNPEGGRGHSSSGSGGRGGASTGGSATTSAAGHSGAASGGLQPPSTGGGDAGGCGCRVAERKSSTNGALYLLFGLVLAWRKRRRSLT
jgi:MYXO-CTERM domain-containing protein